MAKTATEFAKFVMAAEKANMPEFKCLVRNKEN